MNRKSGFTLIELMVVVSIIGILAATAIPAFGKYLKRSKTTEALVNLRKIYDGEIAYFQMEHVKSDGTVASTHFVWTFCQPIGVPSDAKRRAFWEDIGWPHINFSTDGPVYYTYMVQTIPGPSSNNTPGCGFQIPGFGYQPPPQIKDAFLVRAFGDLDSDSELSEFDRYALVDSTTGNIQGLGGVWQLDELE